MTAKAQKKSKGCSSKSGGKAHGYKDVEKNQRDAALISRDSTVIAVWDNVENSS